MPNKYVKLSFNICINEMFTSKTFNEEYCSIKTYHGLLKKKNKAISSQSNANAISKISKDHAIKGFLG